MKKQLTKGQRAEMSLQILRTAKKNPEFEKMLISRMNKEAQKNKANEEKKTEGERDYKSP